MTTISYRQKAEFDGVGYINNRGSSKYWGVTHTSGGEVMVSVQHPSKPTTINISAINFKMSEVAGARIAAYFYENYNKELPPTFQVTDGHMHYTVSLSGNSGRVSRKYSPVKRNTVTKHVNTTQQEDSVKVNDVFNRKDKQVLVRMLSIMHNNEMTLDGLQTLQQMVNDRLNNGYKGA